MVATNEETHRLMRDYDGMDRGGGKYAVAVGPMEITRARRTAILCGLWMATFLSVSSWCLHVCISLTF